MPPDYTKDMFTIELDHLHDIQLLLEKLVLAISGSTALGALPLKTHIVTIVP